MHVGTAFRAYHPDINQFSENICPFEVALHLRSAINTLEPLPTFMTFDPLVFN